jgi:YbbR domain-containing protein
VERTTVTPESVTIEGPESHVQEVEAVSTTPINMKDRTATFTETVDLDITDPVVRVPKSTSVKVEIQIRRINR